MKKIIAKLMLMTLLGGLAVSCGDDEFVADAAGDAFILSKIQGQGEEATIVYGLALHAFGNKDFSKVTVTSPDNVTTDLVPYVGVPYDYYYETDEDEFTPEPPAPGNYNFSFTFTSSETGTDVDELTEDVLLPATITKCEYNEAESRIEMTWDAVDDADFLVIYLENAAGELIYISEALRGTTTSHNISSTTSHWYQTPDVGETYTAIVGAFMYETVAVDLNIQAKSIATATVVWGGAN
jgi:hypothetical protein